MLCHQKIAQTMFFAPNTHKDCGLAYNPIKAIISPRPIGWVSSKGSDGSVNLAPYSFFNGISDDPAMVMFAVAANGDGTPKDSLRNISETNAFTINIVGARHIDAMNVSSGNYPYGENEFDAAGLDMVPGETIDVPRVSQAPAALECTHYQTVNLPAGPAGTFYSMVIGTITGVYIDDAVIVDGKLSYDKYVPICRLGYHDYAQITEVFSLQRPVIER